MSKHFCVFDFETDSLDTATCNPVEVACIMIDPFTLDIINGSEFQSYMRPIGIENRAEYLSDKGRRSTIDFHCKLHNVNVDQLLEEWEKYPDPEVVWNMFAKHTLKYNKKQSAWDAPIPAGQNIRNFDLPIAYRLNEKYKTPKVFHKTEIVDLRDLSYYWLQWDSTLTSRSMDNLRKYFNIASQGLAHTAIADVKEEAELIMKFLKLHKDLFRRIKFKGELENV